MKGKAWLFNLLGSLSSALAVISLVQRVANLGLKPVFHGILQSYRSAVAPIRDMIWNAFHWLAWDIHIPNIIVDLLVISSIGAVALVKITDEEEAYEQGSTLNLKRIVRLILGWFLLTILFAGLLNVLMCIIAAPFLVARKYDRVVFDRDSQRRVARMVLSGFAGAAIFFALNYAIS